MASSTQTFETPDGRRFTIRYQSGGKRRPGIAGAWPPTGWICAPEGQELDINATRPDVRDAIAHATRIGPDQPWLVELADRLDAERA